MVSIPISIPAFGIGDIHVIEFGEIHVIWFSINVLIYLVSVSSFGIDIGIVPNPTAFLHNANSRKGVVRRDSRRE